MAAVTDLLDRKLGPPLAYLFVVEGIPTMWCQGYYASHETTLYGSGVSSWIGTAYGARTVKPGLTLPDPIYEESISPTAGGILDNFIEVTLQDDETNYLASLLKSQWDASELTRLGERLAPSDDPAPATLKGWDQLTNVTVRDRHIGNEYIDGDGNRRSLYITPDTGSGKPPGLDHPVLSDQGDGQLPAVYVSTQPHNFVGRLCAIYEIAYDEDLGVWANWQNQYDGGALIWLGRLTDKIRYQGGKKWKVQCHGSASWLRKRLWSHMSTREWTALPTLNLSQEQGSDETWCGVFFHRRGWGNYSGQSGEFLNYNWNWHADNRFGSSDSLRAISIRIYDVLRTAASGASSDYGAAETVGVDSGTNDTTNGAYFENENAGLGYLANGDPDEGSWYSIQIPDSSNETDLNGLSGNFSGHMLIVLHAKVWEALGWDLSIGLGGGQGAFSHGFEEIKKPINMPEGVQYPGPGYWIGYFSTPENSDVIADLYDNNGATQTWIAPWKDNVVVLDPAGKQWVQIGLDKIYIEGQNVRPPDLDQSTNSTTHNAMGWFLFSGPVKSPYTDEAIEHWEVARCSWAVDSDGSIRQDANGNTVIWIIEWEDPRVFGFPHRRFEVEGKKLEAWRVLAGSLKMRQIVAIPGYRPGTPDDNYRALTAILAASGTAGTSTSNGWTGVNSPPSVGDNDGGVGTIWGSDLEFADGGLGIEPDRVDHQAFLDVAGDYLGDAAARLNRFRWSTIEPVLSQDIIEAICRTRGWCMRLKWSAKGPQFSIFSPFLWSTDDDVEVALTESDIHGSAGDPLSWTIEQESRWESPVDRFSIEAGFDPVTESPSIKVSEYSWDTWRRGREGLNELDIVGRGLVDPRKFRLDEWTGANWISEFRVLHAMTIGPWRAERHFVVRTKRMRGATARKLKPGACVALTDQRVLAPGGTYGVTSHVGHVLTERRHLGGWVDAEILMQARDAQAVRYWSAIGVVDGFDTAAKTLTLLDDFAEHNVPGRVDADGFDEQGWNTQLGGTAKLKVIQSWDGGETWDSGDDVTFTGATVSGNVITYQSLDSGTLYPDTFKHLLFQDADQHAADAWPVLRYSIITNEQGKYGGSSTQGHELF